MNKQLLLLTLISLSLFGATDTVKSKDKATLLQAQSQKLLYDSSIDSTGVTKKLNALIIEGLDINAVDKDGNVLLCHTIAPIPKPEITACLLSAGAQLPTHVQNFHKLLMGKNSFTDEDPTMTLLKFAMLRAKTSIWTQAHALTNIKLLYEAGMPGITEIEEYNKDAITSGLQRKKARQANRETQLALLQTALENSHLLKDLLLIIRDYIGLAYTAQDNVPLTLIDGPASC